MANIIERIFSTPIEKDKGILNKVKDLEKDIITMHKFLSDKGIEISDSINKDISTLTTNIAEIEHFCKHPNKQEIPESKKISDFEEYETLYYNSLSVYNKLTKLTYPANPETINYTKQAYGLFFANNKVINLIIILTILCLILFLISYSLNDKSIYQLLSLLFASGLGAGFYTLSSSRKYLVNRTFDPSYNPTYLIRFLLGITAGTILALIFKDVIQIENFHFSDEILAVVGGFSADAVSTILERVAELIIAVFKGTNQNDSHEVSSKIKAGKESQKQEDKLNSLNSLAEIKAKAIEHGASSDIISAIDEKMKNV
ncbi:MAG: hypothetical protein JEY96_11150 [Bacteroidales bacterium]|nr:hypothetical protein [Bacteroidales bacterium]